MANAQQLVMNDKPYCRAMEVEAAVKPTRMGMDATGLSNRAWNDDVASNDCDGLLDGRPWKRTRSLLPAVMAIMVAASSTTAEKPPTSTYSRTVELVPSLSNPVNTKLTSDTRVLVPYSRKVNVKSTYPAAENLLAGSNAGGSALASTVMVPVPDVDVMVRLASTEYSPTFVMLVYRYTAPALAAVPDTSVNDAKLTAV